MVRPKLPHSASAQRQRFFFKAITSSLSQKEQAGLRKTSGERFRNGCCCACCCSIIGKLHLQMQALDKKQPVLMAAIGVVSQKGAPQGESRTQSKCNCRGWNIQKSRQRKVWWKRLGQFVLNHNIVWATDRAVVFRFRQKHHRLTAVLLFPEHLLVVPQQFFHTYYINMLKQVDQYRVCVEDTKPTEQHCTVCPVLPMTWQYLQGLKCQVFARDRKKEEGSWGLSKGHSAGKSQLDVSVKLEI